MPKKWREKSTEQMINEIHENKFEDKKMYDIYIKYLETYKTRNNIQENTFKSQIYKILKITPLISNYYLQHFGWEQFRKLVLNHQTLVRHLFSYYVYLTENFYLNEIEIDKINHLIPYLKRSVTNEDLIEIAKQKELCKYFFTWARKNQKYGSLYFIDTENSFVRNLLKEFILDSPGTQDKYKEFYSLFHKSFPSNIEIDNLKNIYEFNFEVFTFQFQFYETHSQQSLYALRQFYIFLFRNTDDNHLFGKVPKIDYYALKNNNFIQKFKDGYQTVFFNPSEEVPSHDKWFLNVNGYDYNTSSVNGEKCYIVDFSDISNPIFKHWTKLWFWNDSQSLYTKLHGYPKIKHFLNYIQDLKEGKELSIYVLKRKTKPNEISLEEVIAYKNMVLSTYENNRTINSYIYNPKSFVNYLHDEGITKLEAGIFYHLTNFIDQDYDNSKNIPDEELKKLSAIMKTKSEQSIENALCYAIFYIALETEFRISQITSLEIDCVKEANKKNQYYIKSITKTSRGEKVRQAITIYVKKHIDQIKKITEPIRNSCKVESTRKYLFIKKSPVLGEITPFTPSFFNGFLKDCCLEAGIPIYTASNLRNTHMTKAKEYVLRNSLSDLEQSVLTGHKNPDTTSNHYTEYKIKEMLELVHGTMIGDIDVNGQIVETANKKIANKENEVSNGCGYCGIEKCNIFNLLDCMMCNRFVATVDRIPYFEEQIKVINEKIKNASTPHDKEDFINIKQLLLNYLSRLLLKKENSKNVI